MDPQEGAAEVRTGARSNHASYHLQQHWGLYTERAKHGVFVFSVIVLSFTRAQSLSCQRERMT